ncbi:MAG: purine-nucleoside phosphorylase [Clostridiales bacterium]|nr:purine-nucleoside phosphorylase [Clostridiales bacterium]
MSLTPTPHNNGLKEQLADIVLMQGDPLRTKYVAENYLTDVQQFTDVRNIYGYTGSYKGRKVSVMGHGIGMPSIGVYSYELFHFYDVSTIIRTGSAGLIHPDLHLRDVLLAQGSCTDSNYASQYQLPGTFAPIADFRLLHTAYRKAEELDIPVAVGNVITTDVFYNVNSRFNQSWADMGVLAVEMEAAALYMNAAEAGKKALCMCTVSDDLVRGEYMTTEERQTGLNKMLTLALETAAVL